MNAHSIMRSSFFYLGIGLVCLPFLKGRIIWLPLLVLAGWGLTRAANAAGAGRGIASSRSRIARIISQHSGMAAGAALVAASLMPFISSSYMLDVLTSAALYAILAIALNVTVGLTGVLVLGFIGFYAIGAYTTGILTAKFALVGFWPAVVLSGLAAMACGLILGIPALRLKGDYLAIVTLGFGEIIRIFLLNLTTLTGGPNGILGIPRPSLGPYVLNDQHSFYWLVIAVLSMVFLFASRLSESRYGRAWIAIRENEMAAGALGIDVFRKHLLSFSISAFFGGIAGSLFAAKQGFISPDSFTFFESVMVLCMVVLGGIGSTAGAAIGALLLIVLPELLREFALYRMLVFGILVIAFMVFRPQGLAGSRRIAGEMCGSRDSGND